MKRSDFYGFESEIFYIFELKFHKGLSASQGTLGSMYAHGYGCQKDKDIAVSWLKKAANQGSTDAQDQINFIVT